MNKAKNELPTKEATLFKQILVTIYMRLKIKLLILM
jgi:hypothetical protein